MSQSKEEQVKQTHHRTADYFANLTPEHVDLHARRMGILKWHETEETEYLRTQLMLHSSGSASG